MQINFMCSKAVKKAIIIGSVLTLTSSMTACNSANNSNDKTSNESNNNTKTTTNDLTKFENGEKKPNVIYIILDDIGFSDLGCYGSEIRTPNIDQLAANGLRYNNFNACPFSSATRASLLTGRENNSVGMGQVANVSLEADKPNLQGRVTPAAGLISEILNDSGFSTLGIGKWHIAPTYTVTPAGPFTYWPLSKGFDRYYGFMDGETDQFSPQLVNGNELIAAPDSEDYNLNDDLLAHAKQYIADQVSLYPDKPFFMNYGFGTGHSPIQVPDSYMESYDGVYDEGWDVIREERFNRQKELRIIPDTATLPASDTSVKSWGSLSSDEKKLYTKFMEAYAGYITQADEEVGKLIDYLKEVGQYDNTMIVLIGDNGATNSGGPDGTDSFISAFAAGRIPTAEELMNKYDLIGTSEMQALYPIGWGQVSNTPFRNYKGSVYAGALRNPLIISWPNGIEDKGGIRNQYVHVTDITPTVLDILEIETPEVINGVTQMPMYGTSIASTFDSSETAEVRTTAITYKVPDRAIYDNGWKAIAIHTNGTSFDEDVWELYHVSEDYSESTNVAKQYPDKLKELQELFMSEAEKFNILPLFESTSRDMGYIRSDSSANRSTLKYYPGVGFINVSAAPPVNVSSFTLTVPITRESESDSGVLVAMGDEMGGYTFYIKDNKLVFLYNKFGTISKITSNIDVPIGESELKFDFERASMTGGTGTMYINGENVGEGELETSATITLEGLSIGKDSFLPVSDDYKELGEFPFTGKLNYVQFDITHFNPQTSKK